MEFQDVVRRRKMVRSYSTEPVDPAVVDLALHNATRAPNAGFSQGWAFLVLDTPDDVRRFWVAASDDIDHPDEWLTGMMRAPVVILPCFIGIPPDKEAAVHAAFAIPDDFDPVGVVTIGHHATGEGAKGSPTRRARKPVADVVHRGRWGQLGGHQA